MVNFLFNNFIESKIVKNGKVFKGDKIFKNLNNTEFNSWCISTWMQHWRCLQFSRYPDWFGFQKVLSEEIPKSWGCIFQKVWPKVSLPQNRKIEDEKFLAGTTNGLRPKGVSLHQFWRLKIIGTLFRLNYFSGKIFPKGLFTQQRKCDVFTLG